MSDPIFADGLRVEIPAKAPEFIKMRLSFHAADFTTFLSDYKNDRGWVNIDVKLSKNGKLYAELNTWKKSDSGAPTRVNEVSKVESTVEYPEEELNPDDIPF